jgi:hypothetical protein
VKVNEEFTGQGLAPLPRVGRAQRGFLGQRLARAALSRAVRASSSAGVYVLGTPLARRPRDWAALFFMGLTVEGIGFLNDGFHFRAFVVGKGFRHGGKEFPAAFPRAVGGVLANDLESVFVDADDGGNLPAGGANAEGVLAEGLFGDGDGRFVGSCIHDFVFCWGLKFDGGLVSSPPGWLRLVAPRCGVVFSHVPDDLGGNVVLELDEEMVKGAFGNVAFAALIDQALHGLVDHDGGCVQFEFKLEGGIVAGVVGGGAFSIPLINGITIHVEEVGGEAVKVFILAERIVEAGEFRPVEHPVEVRGFAVEVGDDFVDAIFVYDERGHVVPFSLAALKTRYSGLPLVSYPLQRHQCGFCLERVCIHYGGDNHISGCVCQLFIFGVMK